MQSVNDLASSNMRHADAGRENRVAREDLQFEKIHAAFRQKIQGYLTRLVGEGEAEDLTQEVFARVSRALHTFRGESQLSTWIYGIATHAAIDKIRSPSFRLQAQTSSLDDSSEIECQDTMTGKAPPSLEEQILRAERYECFRNFVGNLPLDYRTVFVMSALGELSDNEIAEILGVSVALVKIRLHRARTRLFRELKAHCKAEDWL